MRVVAGGNVGLVVVADHGLDDGEGGPYHHSHHQQLHRQFQLQQQQQQQRQEQLQQRQLQQIKDEERNESTIVATSTSLSAAAGTGKYPRTPPDYRHQRMLREHHRQHGYNCPLCCRTLHDISAMRAHLDHHYPRDSPTCPVVACAKTFSHPNSVRNHMRLKHPLQWEQIKTLRWTYV